MKDYQREFIEFALAKQVLRFGEFTLKSGRTSPYFFNAGLFNTGRDLARLGRFYAAALQDSNIEYNLFKLSLLLDLINIESLNLKKTPTPVKTPPI